MIRICAAHEIDEGQTKSFEAQGQPCFLLRHEGRLYGYINRCPHLGIELNWKPDHFLDVEKIHIQCSTHGALFLPHNGYCIEGPCRGQSLKALPVFEQAGDIHCHIEDVLQ